MIKRIKMNNDAVINRIAHTLGCSRKEVLEVLKKTGQLYTGKNSPMK